MILFSFIFSFVASEYKSFAKTSISKHFSAVLLSDVTSLFLVKTGILLLEEIREISQLTDVIASNLIIKVEMEV